MNDFVLPELNHGYEWTFELSDDATRLKLAVSDGYEDLFCKWVYLSGHPLSDASRLVLEAHALQSRQHAFVELAELLQRRPHPEKI